MGSTLSLMAPALIDSAAHWNSDTGALFVYRSVKNSVVFLIGFLACIIGTYINPSGGRETGASRKRQSPVDSAGFLERRADRENPGERRKTPVPVRTELRIRSPR